MKREFKIPDSVRGRLSLDPQTCPEPGCSQGWIDTPQGAARCPRCRRQADEARLGQAGVVGSRLDRPWTDMRLRHKSWRRVQEVSLALPDLIAEGRGLALIGLPGTGTSQAAALLVRGAAEAGLSALMVSWPSWVEAVQADYTRQLRTQAEHVAALSTPALLALDAVGEAATSTGALERKLLERVLGVRYAAGKSTIITAGMTRRELEEAMGERTFDRFRHSAEWVLFNGPNEREEEERRAREEREARAAALERSQRGAAV
ncbi:hypothetical protein DEIPH_ctg017orf0220 [Deinococcus phoenicis]|uniref:IstB-like ATP-binding domain-containing protein n=1 Tax=Deinococcus phoenicis TaxID=1476583 RepID=A0A016QSG1_9DEIO|nr:ATP-binding protein [Deinococcus phoenicis]EYB68842.1 hypothetical protein DEIPH_ctg017orf0220 [Deinococcus phoenicis]